MDDEIDPRHVRFVRHDCDNADNYSGDLSDVNGLRSNLDFTGLLTVPLSVIADIGGMLGVRVGSLI
jgi:hypothetical protein